MKTILFDFDGVLVDSERQKFSSLQKLLREKNVVLPDESFSKFIGKKTKLILEENTSLSVKEQDEIIKKRQENIVVEFFPLVIEELKSLDAKLGIVTGSQRALVEKMLQEKGIAKLFSVIICGEDFSSSKPDPECYLLALEKLGVNPKEVIVVEDSPAGVISGKKAGCIVYGLLTSVNSLDADKVFSTHEELFREIKLS